MIAIQIRVEVSWHGGGAVIEDGWEVFPAVGHVFVLTQVTVTQAFTVILSRETYISILYTFLCICCI